MWIRKQAGVLALAFGSLVSVAEAAPVTTQCGASIRSTVKTEIGVFNTTSEIPVNITGASATFNVPAGTSQCVKIRFSAVANCELSCFLRAFDNGNELNPAWFSNALRFSTDATNNGAAHSFEWVKRVGPGNHTVQIKIQTGNTAKVASIGPWTTTVELTK